MPACGRLAPVCFLLGSTIVMLFGPGTIAFNENWAPERPVRLGELMGNRPA